MSEQNLLANPTYPPTLPPSLPHLELRQLCQLPIEGQTRLDQRLAHPFPLLLLRLLPPSRPPSRPPSTPGGGLEEGVHQVVGRKLGTEKA